MEKQYWLLRKFIEFCFTNENDILLAVSEKRFDNVRPANVGGHSGISKPTESEALRNITPIKSVVVAGNIIPFPEQWIKVVKNVKAHYNNMQAGKLYALHYCQKQKRGKVLRAMNISKTRYHQLIIEIIDFAINTAQGINLVDEEGEIKWH